MASRTRISRWLLLGGLSLAVALCLCDFALAAAQSKQPPPPKPLDINTATPAELETVPGVGPVTAKAIVNFREKSGPFRRLEDLLVIRGITKRKLEKLRPYLTVGNSREGKSG